MDDQSILWSELLTLPEWHLLFAPQLSPPSPHVMMVDDKHWVLIFTDPDRLQAFAPEHGLVLDGDKALYTSLSVPDARKMLRSMAQSGIDGVRFNQGAHGWFAPLDSIESIHAFLTNSGQLKRND